MSRILVAAVGLTVSLFFDSAMAQAPAPVQATGATRAAAAAPAGPIPREERAQARRDCYGENIALSGEDLRRAMRACMQARFPGVPLYADKGVTRDGKPTANAVRAACKDEIDKRGLAGSGRTAALVACFNDRRPDLAQRAECRKEARGKGLDGEALRSAIADCARAGRS